MPNIDRERAVHGEEQKRRGMFVTAQQFTSGDPEVFAGLFPAMRRLATRIVGEHEAEDIAQEAWISASQRLSGELPQSVRELGGNVVPYVRRAVINAAKMHIRSSSRSSVRERRVHFLTERIRPGTDFPDEEGLSAEEIAGHLRNAIKGKKNFEAYMLVKKDGLRHQEAADMLGVSLNTFQLRVKRAIAHVKKYLEETDLDS